MKSKRKKILILSLILIINVIFIDFVVADTYNNVEIVKPLSCGLDKNGVALLSDIPPLLPKVVSIIYIAIQIAVPVILVIMGSLDLMKGITAQKDDDIKKGQQLFIKRLIAAAIIFLVFIIVKLVVSLAADKNENRILDCAQCFIKNECIVQK